MKVLVEATPVLPRPSRVGLYLINLLAAHRPGYPGRLPIPTLG